MPSKNALTETTLCWELKISCITASADQREESLDLLVTIKASYLLELSAGSTIGRESFQFSSVLYICCPCYVYVCMQAYITGLL